MDTVPATRGDSVSPKNPKKLLFSAPGPSSSISFKLGNQKFSKFSELWDEKAEDAVKNLNRSEHDKTIKERVEQTKATLSYHAKILDVMVGCERIPEHEFVEILRNCGFENPTGAISAVRSARNNTNKSHFMMSVQLNYTIARDKDGFFIAIPLAEDDDRGKKDPEAKMSMNQSIYMLPPKQVVVPPAPQRLVFYVLDAKVTNGVIDETLRHKWHLIRTTADVPIDAFISSVKNDWCERTLETLTVSEAVDLSPATPQETEYYSRKIVRIQDLNAKDCAVFAEENENLGKLHSDTGGWLRCIRTNNEEWLQYIPEMFVPARPPPDAAA